MMSIAHYPASPPSATGVTIVSTQGGSTFNWASNDGIDPNSASFTLTVEPLPALADGTNQIEIYDSAGRMVRGVLGSVGTGETLDSELLTSFTNSTPAYDTFTVVGKDIASAINDGVDAPLSISNLYTTIAGGLYKFSVNFTLVSGFVQKVTQLRGDDGAYLFQNVYLAAGVNNFYRTDSTGGASAKNYIRGDLGNATNFSSVNSSKQVLTPSASGATIVSTELGATQNFSYKNALFTYNAASYVVKIYKPVYAQRRWRKCLF